MSVEVMRTVIDAAEGRVPVDTLFTNAQIIDVYGQRVAPGSVAVDDLSCLVGASGIVATIVEHADDLVCHQAFFPRHTLVEPYDLNYRYSADFDWCIRIMKKARTLHNTHLTIIDYLDEGMTTQNRKASLKERFRIMAKHYGWISTAAHHAWFVLRLITKPGQ